MTVSLLDNFNRANENPLSDGSKWSTGTPATSTALKLVSNQAVRQGANGVFGRDGCYWNAMTVTAGLSCSVFHTVGNAGSDGEIDVGFFNSTSTVGYILAGTVGTFGTTYALSRYDTGYVPTQLGSTFSRALTTNDKAQLWIDKNDIVALLDTGTGWKEVLRSTDSTYRLVWTPFWEIAGLNDGSSAAVDNAYAGPTDNPLGDRTLLQSVKRSSTY